MLRVHIDNKEYPKASRGRLYRCPLVGLAHTGPIAHAVLMSWQLAFARVDPIDVYAQCDLSHCGSIASVYTSISPSCRSVPTQTSTRPCQVPRKVDAQIDKTLSRDIPCKKAHRTLLPVCNNGCPATISKKRCRPSRRCSTTSSVKRLVNTCICVSTPGPGHVP